MITAGTKGCCYQSAVTPLFNRFLSVDRAMCPHWPHKCVLTPCEVVKRRHAGAVDCMMASLIPIICAGASCGESSERCVHFEYAQKRTPCSRVEESSGDQKSCSKKWVLRTPAFYSRFLHKGDCVLLLMWVSFLPSQWRCRCLKASSCSLAPSLTSLRGE